MEISFLPAEFGLGYGGVRNLVGVEDGIGTELEEEVRDLMSERKRRLGVVMVEWVYVVVVSRAYRVQFDWLQCIGRRRGSSSSSFFVLLALSPGSCLIFWTLLPLLAGPPRGKREYVQPSRGSSLNAASSSSSNLLPCIASLNVKPSPSFQSQSTPSRSSLLDRYYKSQQLRRALD